MKLFSLIIAALVLGWHTVGSAQVVDEIVEISNDKPVVLRQDRGYILLRSNVSGNGPVFMRIPTDQEMADYEIAKKAEFEKKLPDLLEKRNSLLKKRPNANIPLPSLETYNFYYDKVYNLQGIYTGAEFEKGPEYKTFLLEVVPGDYVIYGVGFSGISLTTCFCLGTVQIATIPGEIVDAGQFLLGAGSGTEKSIYPELAAETGFGPGMAGHNIMFAGAIRLKNTSMTVPAALNNFRISPAKFSAVGKFVSTSSFNIARLAAMPGVLAYDDGKVIDVPTGKVMPNNY